VQLEGQVLPFAHHRPLVPKRVVGRVCVIGEVGPPAPEWHKGSRVSLQEVPARGPRC
jgi:hypothetical protein